MIIINTRDTVSRAQWASIPASLSDPMLDNIADEFKRSDKWNALNRVTLGLDLLDWVDYLRKEGKLDREAYWKYTTSINVNFDVRLGNFPKCRQWSSKPNMSGHMVFVVIVNTVSIQLRLKVDKGTTTSYIRDAIKRVEGLIRGLNTYSGVYFQHSHDEFMRRVYREGTLKVIELSIEEVRIMQDRLQLACLKTLKEEGTL